MAVFNLNTRIDVLIIDDDKDICEIYTEYLNTMQKFNKIIVAHDGSLASLKLANQHFGLILLDITMPKKSGLDLIIKEFAGTATKQKKEKVLVISGTLDQNVLTHMVKNGFTNFLVKPVDEATFTAKVTKMLGLTVNPI